ncbi:MAG: acyl-phosphate glycerol 3-phosphate acyltransferase, partial [Gammaproteobacteria bacterium]
MRRGGSGPISNEMSPDEPDSTTEAHALASRLLSVVRALVVELTPERAHLDINLDSNLDRDLGFDSLSRVELLLRLERDLQVQLPEQAYASAETPRDLARAARASATQTGSRQAFAIPAIEAEPPSGADHPPASVTTLQGVLAWQVENNGDRTHVLLYESEADTPIALTHAALQQGAEQIAIGLVAAGLQPGDAVSIMLP